MKYSSELLVSKDLKLTMEKAYRVKNVLFILGNQYLHKEIPRSLLADPFAFSLVCFQLHGFPLTAIGAN